MQSVAHPEVIPELVGRLADSVNQANTLEELVRPLLELLQTVTGMESTYLTTVDLAAGQQHVLYARNSRQMQISEGLTVPWGDTLCRRALEEGRTYTDDVASCWGDSEAARGLGIATYLSSQVRTCDGELYGTLCAASDQRRPEPPGVAALLGMFARLIALQVDRERMLQELQRANDALSISAHVDTTTRLPNRRALFEEMRKRMQAVNPDRALLVMFIDLDGFKVINDTHGHDVGDHFLVAVGERLHHASREGDFVARLGGDEFVVLCDAPRQDATATARLLGCRLQAATVGCYVLGKVELDYAGPSIGIAVSEPGEVDVEAALARADAAMYRMKRQRKLVANA